MDCRQYQEDLTAYMDGELSSSRAAEIETHVQQCTLCNDELEGLRGSALFLERSTRELELKPLLWRNVRAHISTMERPVARPKLLQLIAGHRLATGVATLAAVFTLGVGVWSYRERRADEMHLRQYMNEYVRSREIQEIQEIKDGPPYRIPAVTSDDPGYTDNPFVTVRPVSFENPFRSEAR
jgi:hypothetical protein